MKELVIVGSGRALASASALARRQGRVFRSIEARTHDGFTFDGGEALASCSPEKVELFVALDGRAINSARVLLIHMLSEVGYSFTNLVAPDSYLADSVSLGANVYVGPGCHLLERVCVGEGSWLESAVVVDCAAKVGDFCTLGIGVVLEHAAQVGRQSTLSAGSRVGAGGKVGEQCEWLLGGKLPQVLPDRSFHDEAMPDGAYIMRGKRAFV